MIPQPGHPCPSTCRLQIIRQDHKLQFFKGCLRSSGQVLDKFLLLHMCCDRTVVRYQVQQASTQISRAIAVHVFWPSLVYLGLVVVEFLTASAGDARI